MWTRNLCKRRCSSGKLISQLCSSVLWHQSVDWLVAAGHSHFVEVGPKKVLRGLMRRIHRDAKVLNVEDPAAWPLFCKPISRVCGNRAAFSEDVRSQGLAG